MSMILGCGLGKLYFVVLLWTGVVAALIALGVGATFVPVYGWRRSLVHFAVTLAISWFAMFQGVVACT